MIKLFQMINTNSYYVGGFRVKYIFLYWLLKVSVILSHYFYNYKKIIQTFQTDPCVRMGEIYWSAHYLFIN